MSHAWFLNGGLFGHRAYWRRAQCGGGREIVDGWFLRAQQDMHRRRGDVALFDVEAAAVPTGVAALVLVHHRYEGEGPH